MSKSKKEDKHSKKTHSQASKASKSPAARSASGIQGQQTRFEFRDMTAERQYALQLSQAQTLYMQDRFDEVITLLQPLLQKFPDRVPLLELLAGAYSKAGYSIPARDLLEMLLRLTPNTRSGAAMGVRFNLAQLYLSTGFPNLAYELSLALDPFELSWQSGQRSLVEACREFQSLCRQMVVSLATENAMTLEEYLPFATELDRGRLALERTPAPDLTQATLAFQKAARLKPTNPVSYNNLALTLQAAGRSEEALSQYRYVLEKLDKTNLHALSGLVRILVSLGRGAQEEDDDDEQLQSYLRKLERLKSKSKSKGEEWRTNPLPLLKLAEAYVALEDDNKVFKLLDPLIGDTLDENYPPRLLLQKLDPDGYAKALAMLAVAAANLGDVNRALEVIEELESYVGQLSPLIARLQDALIFDEKGPRPHGRFYYWDPLTMYPGPVRSFQERAVQAAQEFKYKSRPQSGKRAAAAATGSHYQAPSLLELLRPFFEENSRAALDYLTFTYWITSSTEPAHLFALALQAINAKDTRAVEVVRRFAFDERVGNSWQRLYAAQALLDAGEISPQERVTIWIGVLPRTGTVEELGRWLERAELANQRRLEKLRTEFTAELRVSEETGELLRLALDTQRRHSGSRQISIEASRKLVEKYPDDATYRQLLASRLGEDPFSSREELAEAVTILQALLAQDPGYNLAHITLARVLVNQEQLEEAERELGLVEENLSGFDIDEVLSYYYACIRLYQEQERYAQALEVSHRLLEIEPDDEFALGSVEYLEMLLKVGGVAGLMEEQREKARKRNWQRWGHSLIRPNTEIQELLELFNKDELAAILAAWQAPFDKRKGSKAAYLSQVQHLLAPRRFEELKNSEVTLSGAALIDEEADQALWQLLKLGGYAPYEEWQKAAGFEDGLRAEQYLRMSRLEPWEKLPGRLQARGLVYLGEVEGEGGGLMALVPADLRVVLGQLLGLLRRGEERRGHTNR